MSTNFNIMTVRPLRGSSLIVCDLDPLVAAKIDGVPVFECHYGTARNHYAIKIENLLTGSNLGWLGDTRK